MVLVKSLPQESAVARAENAWTYRDEMMAMVAERTDQWGRLTYDIMQKVHAKHPQNLPEPLVIRHPAREALRERAEADNGVGAGPVQQKVSIREAIERLGGRVN